MARGNKRGRPKPASRSWHRHALPVRIKRSALGDGIPHRNLYLTLGHGVLVDGLLVTASSLINDATILVDEAENFDRLEYYHVQTEHPDIITAEGTPCETWTEGQQQLPVIDWGQRERAKSHVRIALSPWWDRRNMLDLVREKLEQRAAA